MSPIRPQHAVLRNLPVVLALLAIGAIYTLVSERLAVGPRGLVPGLLVTLAVLLLAALGGGRWGLARAVGIVVLAVVTIAQIVGASLLVADLFTSAQRMAEESRQMARSLFRDAALIWLVNILTFALWYWEIDDGGPMRRHQAGYRDTDFIFPRPPPPTAAAAAPWVPHFVDYLFLAFTTSTAFSPTDTLVVSIRAKLLVMIQASTSLTVLTILAARAINSL